jgi:hypothetical protein
MAIVHRVTIFVNGVLFETKDFTNRVTADQYADKRHEELDRAYANVETKVDSLQTSQ